MTNSEADHAADLIIEAINNLTDHLHSVQSKVLKSLTHKLEEVAVNVTGIADITTGKERVWLLNDLLLTEYIRTKLIPVMLNSEPLNHEQLKCKFTA